MRFQQRHMMFRYAAKNNLNPKIQNQLIAFEKQIDLVKPIFTSLTISGNSILVDANDLISATTGKHKDLMREVANAIKVTPDTAIKHVATHKGLIFRKIMTNNPAKSFKGLVNKLKEFLFILRNVTGYRYNEVWYGFYSEEGKHNRAKLKGKY